MMRKLFLLLLIGAAVWFGARALVHRGEIKATVVFHHARDLRKGDPVVADGAQIGVVTKVTHLDGDDAVSIRIDSEHRRDVVSDSLFAIDRHRLMVTNSFAVGSPSADGDVQRGTTAGPSPTKRRPRCCPKRGASPSRRWPRSIRCRKATRPPRNRSASSPTGPVPSSSWASK